MNDLVVKDPFSSLFSFPRWMDDFETDSKGLKLRETEDSIIAEAVVAGVPAKDVEVTIEAGVLTIKASKEEEDKSDDTYKSSSRRYYYSAALSPSAGEWDKVEADIEDGIVTITIPKAKAAKPQKVTVKPKGK